MKLHEGIKKVVEMRSDSIIMDYQFINILSDFQVFSEFPSGKSIVKKICSSKYISCIVELFQNNNCLSQQTIRNEIDRIAYVMSGEYDEEFDLVRYCFESIAYGLGLLTTINGYYTVDNFKHAAFIGQWNFKYKNEREIRLDVYRNGKALTSSNIEFEWKPVSDNEIELFIPGIISYRGVLCESIIRGNAKRVFCDEEWLWQAIKIIPPYSMKYLSYSEWTLTNDNPEIEDFVFQFMPNGLLASNKNQGRWYIDDNVLLMSTNNGFLSFYACYNKNGFIGKGKNAMGYEWNIKITRK